MPVPQSTVEFYAAQRQLALTTLVAARAAWAQMNPAGFDASWRAVGPRLMLLLTMAQQQAATAGANYVPAVLADLGMTAPAVAPVMPAALAGVASSGWPLADVLFELVIDAKVRVMEGASGVQALRGTRSLLDGIVTTQIADAGRVASGVSIATRPHVPGYVRMLNPPSCSRCVVLAGKFYRWNTGFERHPRCDCRHIPASEDMFDDLRTDPRAYFDSLTPEAQDKAFGKAGAQAIRDGADFSQVVNARSGMYTASVGGRDVLATRSGTTKRGYYAHVQREIDAKRALQTTYVGRDVGRRGAVGHYIERRVGKPRLMPEQIYRIARGDRAEAWRLLAANGYIVGDIRDIASRLA